MSAHSGRLASLLLPPALAALAALAGCGDAPEPPRWTEVDGGRWRPLRVGGGGPGFERVSARDAGIEFVNAVDEERLYENRVLAQGGGVAAGDVDGDGRPDLFFAGTGGRSALYRNLGEWRFEDATGRAGVALEGVPARGAVLADVDGDGDLDLIVTVHAEPNRLFLNDGAGRFEERGDAGFEAALGSSSAALADIDGDGDLDLYVANYKTAQADDLFPPGLRSLERLQPDERGVVRVPPELEGHYRVEFDGRFVRRWELGEPDELYRNDGSGRFRPISFTDGTFLDEEGRPLSDPPRDWGLSVRFQDWDGDGDSDLYVANDFTSPDGVWINQGRGVFRAIPALALRTTSLSSMAVDFSDLERDGDLDLVTTDMLARDPVLRRMQVPSFVPSPDAPGEIGTRHQVNRNTLQLARGDGTYAEAAYRAGLAASDWTWGAVFLDVDLDGYEDLLVTTGHPWDQLDADTHMRLRAAPGAVDWRRELSAFPPLRQPNAAFRNRGDGTFEDVTEAWRFGVERDVSHGIAPVDLDGDGDLDLVATRLGDPPALYRNRSDAPRVAVRLRGTAPNGGAIGARVALRGHPAGEQTKEVAAGGPYLSSGDGAVSFAAAEREMELVVAWPDGRASRLSGVRANRLYEVRQAEAPSPPAEAASPPSPRSDPDDRSGTRVDAARGAPGQRFLEDASVALAHRHAEAPYDDRARQPLLPVSLDRSGPGVTWLDRDGDGDPELIVPSGRGGELAVFRNEGGRLVRDATAGAAARFDQTAVLGLPVASGGQALLVGQTPYEAASPEEALAAPAVLRIAPPGVGEAGSGASAAPRPEPAVPGDRSATGPLAQADVDGDGDLDLFVGGRLIPVAYPIAADSRLLRRVGDRLVPDSAGSEPFRGVGLVSAALFSDLDLDGDPDLALATDWGPVRVFSNEGGRFEEATAELGLAGLRGRWNGLASGDFDEDGRPDLVVTGWGSNTDHALHGDEYTLVYGDLDRNGTLDLVEAVAGPGGALRPLARRDELARGLPFLARRPGGLGAFATATLEELFGEELERAGRLPVRELRHTLLLNRGSRFEAVPLPEEAQLAPSFGVAVGDLDGDGHEDVLLSHNFYPVGPGIPRYDAGRGLWLRGDGTGSLEPVPGELSGIEAYGDGRGLALADYDRDGRVDVAMAQNGAGTKLYRNVGGKPGLRVRLVGPPGNPQAIGARLRVVYGDGAMGPLREVRSGGGYWSRDEAVQTLGLGEGAVAARVSWPGGGTTEVAVDGPGEVVIGPPSRGFPREGR